MPIGKRAILVAVAVSAAIYSCSGPQSGGTTTSSIAASGTAPSSGTTSPDLSQPVRVLVFHRTAGFRHSSIAAGVQYATSLDGGGEFAVSTTEDPSTFSNKELGRFDVVVFLNTTGDVLGDANQRAMEAFIASGNGFVGVHSAADTEYDWEWYGGLVGTYFARHPPPQTATLDIADTDHVITRGLPHSFESFDEWYDFVHSPDEGVAILATVDEDTYQGGGMGDPHPIVWAHEYGGGRSVYIGLGHSPDTFSEPPFRALFENALRWTATPPMTG